MSSEDPDYKSKLLLEILKLASEKEIPYTVAQVKKMSIDQLEMVQQEYKNKELDALNETIADVVIIKVEDILKSTSWIKEDSKLATKLQDKRLFKRDLKNIVSYFTPILPWVGLLEGTIVVATEIIEKYSERSNKNKQSDYDVENNSSKTEEGDKQDSS